MFLFARRHVSVDLHLRRPLQVLLGNHQAYLWQYGTPGGDVVFDFRLGRGREGPKQFLQLFEGILQTDGYAAYDRIGGPKIVHAGCWAHARRKFIDACTEERFATELYGQGRQLHAGTMEQAHTIPRIPGAGVIQQPRGELDAPHRDWQKELDPHR